MNRWSDIRRWTGKRSRPVGLPGRAALSLVAAAALLGSACGGDSGQRARDQPATEGTTFAYGVFDEPVSYTHLTLPTNREV